MLEDFVEYIKGNKMAKGITSKEQHKNILVNLIFIPKYSFTANKMNLEVAIVCFLLVIFYAVPMLP